MEKEQNSKVSREQDIGLWHTHAQGRIVNGLLMQKIVCAETQAGIHFKQSLKEDYAR